MTACYQTQPFLGTFGAEIIGLDLHNPLDKPTKSKLSSDLDRYLVLLVRSGEISPEMHLDFSSSFGCPEIHGIVSGLDEDGRITEIRKEPEHQHNFGGTWHFDLSFREEPPVATVLVARTIPASGGDTIWANQYEAYDSLPASVRRRIDTLTAIHSDRAAFGGYTGNEKRQAAEHPLVPVHPGTGKRYLFANPVSIEQVVGLPTDDGKTLLDALYAQATRPEFQYRHRWRQNDIVVWDNRATMHMALNDYDGQRRVMHRISLVSRPT